MKENNQIPKTVDVELANGFLTGFLQNKESNVFVGRKRKLYTSFIFTDYSLDVERKTRDPEDIKDTLYKRAMKYKRRKRTFKVNEWDTLVTTKEEIELSYLAHRQECIEGKRQNLDKKVLGLTTNEMDLYNIVNVISTGGKVTIKKLKEDSFHYVFYIIGDCGFCVMVHRMISKNHSSKYWLVEWNYTI